MTKSPGAYFEDLKSALEKMAATRSGDRCCDFDEAAGSAVEVIRKAGAAGGKVLFIGNGGSASIASHMAIDLLKNAGIGATAFNDGASLTCLANDLGFEEVFAKPIEMLAQPKDVLVAISSSGRSRNILRGVSAARKRGVFVITLSGFGEDNPLRKLGDINFYVPSSEYGYVETAHLALCHYLVDVIVGSKDGVKEKV